MTQRRHNPCCAAQKVARCAGQRIFCMQCSLVVVTGTMEGRFSEGLQLISVLVFPDQQRLDSGTRAMWHVDIQRRSVLYCFYPASCSYRCRQVTLNLFIYQLTKGNSTVLTSPSCFFLYVTVRCQCRWKNCEWICSSSSWMQSVLYINHFPNFRYYFSYNKIN
jgi:hypothetical protein